MSRRWPGLVVALTVVILGLLAGCSSPSGPAGEDGGSDQAGNSRRASIVIPEAAVRQEGDLPISGEGFAPRETVVVASARRAGEALQEVARLTADENGKLPATDLRLPEWLTSGQYHLEVKGEDSGATAEAALNVRAKDRWVMMGRYDPKPFEKLGFVAGGFEPGEGVRIFLMEVPDKPLGESNTDPAGNLEWTEVWMPLLPEGRYTLVVEGKTSGGQVTSDVSLLPLSPTMELTSYAGPPGSSTSLTGSGFVAGETVGVFLGGVDTPVASITADEYGAFYWAGQFDLPYETTPGQVGVTALGMVSQTPVTQQYSVLPLEPWGGFSSYAGYPGATILFRGLGFAAGERVSIYMNDRDSAPVAEAQADAGGTFNGAGPARIPTDATGKVRFVFVGERSGAETEATFEVLQFAIPERGER